MEIPYYELKQGTFEGDDPPDKFKFKYPLDHFQKYGCEAISKNENILVTAHTGAGKTVLAIYAISKWLDHDNSQIIYCSPIKSLSNQKFKEFKEIFKNHNNHPDSDSLFGILTGDVKINPTAKVLIMTAEILRNALITSDSNDNDVYDFKFNPENIKCVILDEVHFINNKDRGKVWEEIISSVNPNIQLIMLSATLSKSDELAKWVGSQKKVKCNLIPTEFRPVPLNHYIYDYSKERNKDFKSDPLTYIFKGKQTDVKGGWIESEWSNVISNIKKFKKKNSINFVSKDGILKDSIKYCKDNSMFPINVFIIDKLKVENVANTLGYSFVDEEKLREINRIWDRYMSKYKKILEETKQWHLIYNLVVKGIGIHHAGLIPILKEIVEILYEEKLLSVLFSTETFAMGVNMPTKTVIFYSTSKKEGDKKRLFRPEEYIQMAGRAGRRGLDSFGTVIILPDHDPVNEIDAKKMILSDPQTLESKLQIDHIFILKRLLLYNQSIDETNEFNDFIISNLNSTLKSRSEEKLYKSILNTNNNEINNLNESFIDSNEILLKNLSSELKHLIDFEFSEDDKNFQNVNEIYLGFLKNKIKSYNIYEELKIFENNIKRKEDFGITIKQGERKKNSKTLDKFNNSLKEQIQLEFNNNIPTESIIDSFNNIYNIIEKFKYYEKEKNQTITTYDKFNFQINEILKFLEKHKCVCIQENTNKINLTQYGRIISEVNECNPLLLGYFLNSEYINDIEFPEIVSTISVIIGDRKSKSYELNDLELSNSANNFLKSLFEYRDYLENEEGILVCKLQFTYESNYNLDLSLYNIVSKWCDTENSWKIISQEYTNFEGVFCRSILRIVNMLRNIELICRITGNSKLLSKLEGYQEKLIRDIVTTESLYI